MVAPDVAGAVTDIRVKDNQSVRIGDTLFVIDPARYRLALEQAEALLAGAKSVLDQRQEEQQRRERLSSDSISEEALNQARTATLSAQAAYDQAEATLGVAKLNMRLGRRGGLFAGDFRRVEIDGRRRALGTAQIRRRLGWFGLVIDHRESSSIPPDAARPIRILFRASRRWARRSIPAISWLGPLA